MDDQPLTRDPHGSLSSLKNDIDIQFTPAAARPLTPTQTGNAPTTPLPTLPVSEQSKQSSSSSSSSPSSSATVSAAVSSDTLTKGRSTPIRSLPSQSHQVLLYIIIILQFSLFLAELITDQFLHSLLILTDSYHHLFNCCNAVLLLVCCKISDQITVKNTFGWVRLELLGLLTTMTFIVALIFSLLIEGLLQIMHLHEFEPSNDNDKEITLKEKTKVLAIFGLASMVVNTIQVFVISCAITSKNKIPKESRRTFSMDECNKVIMKGEGLELKVLDKAPDPITDKAACGLQAVRRTSLNVSLGPISASKTEQCSTVGLIAQAIASPALLLLGSLCIFLLASYELVQITDPLLGIVAALLLCISFTPQLKSTTLILMQTIPENLNIVLMKREILEKFSIIHNVHEVHVWRLTAENVVATCHIVLPSMSAREYASLFAELQSFLRTHYDIGYVTIQPEFFSNTPDYDRAASPVAADACLMQCSNPCRQLSCCTSGIMDSVMVDDGHGHSHSHKNKGHSHGHHGHSHGHGHRH